MSKLENLVPPLELCKQIPDGAFEDSALVWTRSCNEKKEMYLALREDVDFCRKDLVNAPEVLPAPTLQEILIAIEDTGLYCQTCFHQANRWAVDCEDDKSADLYGAEDNDNSATAALNVWLKVNGGVK